MDINSSIYVAGHTGLIGSAIVRRLQYAGYKNLIVKDHDKLELTDSVAVDRFFQEHTPEYVILAAGRVGGIVENQSYPADFINTNLSIQLNVFHAAHKVAVNRLIFFASSCMYPRECPQPMAEGALLSGKLEATSLAYATSKLAGLQMCLAYNQQYGGKRFIPLIPNSAFGPNDNFDPESGHVLSALIRRFHEAKESNADVITLWGSGEPRREFIHADDIADAVLFLLNEEVGDLELPLNIGTGVDFSILELANKVASTVGYSGKIKWDPTKPDGAPRKLLDSTQLFSTGWRPSINFHDGLEKTYQWYLDECIEKKG